MEVYTDHQTIQHLPNQVTLSERQARWSQYLGEFDIRYNYKPGRNNQVADALSRLPTNQVNNIELKQSDTLLKKIRLAYDEDEYFKPVIQALREGEETEDTQEYYTRNGLLYQVKGDRLVIPENDEIRIELLKRSHDQAGHFGAAKTYELLSRNVWWPKIRR